MCEDRTLREFGPEGEDGCRLGRILGIIGTAMKNV